MLTELIELGQKIKEQMKDTQKEIKQKYSGNQQWQEGNQDSKQWFGTKGRNKHPTWTERRNKNLKKGREAEESLGQPETFQYPNYRCARRKRTTARNWKVIWTIMKESFPNLVKEIDFQEVQEAQRVPKKLDPKRNTPRHIIIWYPRLNIKRES